MVDKFKTKGDLHFQRYEPHVLEIPTPQRKISSEKTIFLDPTKYKFNTQPKPNYSIMERFFYWLIR